MRKYVLSLLAATLLSAAVSAAAADGEFRKEGWPVPPTAKAIRLYDDEEKKDLLDGCPGLDVYQEVWVVRVGDLSPEFVQAYGIKLSKDEMISFNVNRLLKGRRIVSYYIDTDKKAPADFSIVDTTGAGVFDTRYPAEKNIPAPAWAVAVCK
jgi:hypothetical protein